jgi:ABC-2 type transport system ATP-binding protein
VSEAIVEADGLVRRFGKVRALDGLNLVARTGQVTAVLGPNGAGKTTFLRTVATLTKPDAGRLRVAGVDVLRHPERVRQVIGLAGQYAAVEPTMTGRQNVRMIARLYGQSRREATVATAAVLSRLGLDEVADQPVTTYSGGLRRRLDLGASLVGSPRLLLLDEPTTGLDPRSRSQLWDAVRALVNAGTDVLLSTQYLDEADQLAHQVAIIDRGRVIAHGTPAELKSLAGRDVIEVRAHRAADLPTLEMALVAALGPLSSGQPRRDPAGARVTVPVSDGRTALAAAAAAVTNLTLDIDDLGLRRPTLDEVFLTLTGNPTDRSSQ